LGIGKSAIKLDNVLYVVGALILEDFRPYAFENQERPGAPTLIRTAGIESDARRAQPITKRGNTRKTPEKRKENVGRHLVLLHQKKVVDPRLATGGSDRIAVAGPTVTKNSRTSKLATAVETDSDSTWEPKQSVSVKMTAFLPQGWENRMWKIVRKNC